MGGREKGLSRAGWLAFAEPVSLSAAPPLPPVPLLPRAGAEDAPGGRAPRGRASCPQQPARPSQSRLPGSDGWTRAAPPVCAPRAAPRAPHPLPPWPARAAGDAASSKMEQTDACRWGRRVGGWREAGGGGRSAGSSCHLCSTAYSCDLANDFASLNLSFPILSLGV